jgi:ABC-type Fe3+ transport system substrate-binding protein
MKQALILLAAALVIALPFIFRREASADGWHRGDPELVVVTPHNEAIRQEFAEGFSTWYREHYGRPVHVDWRVIGGTTEIMRYLTSEYAASARRFFKGQGIRWPANGADIVFSRTRPDGDDAWPLWQAFRLCDRPDEISSRMDVFFGGGVYDHEKAEKLGLTVPAWGTNAPPRGLFSDAAGHVLIPREMNGEVWRGQAYYGSVLSAFGICYNIDRIRDLGAPHPPTAWEDLADPRYVGQLGLADPTKSGSVAKAFEMIVHAQCAKAVAADGFTREQIRSYEERIAAAKGRVGVLPPDVPPGYQAAVERGWLSGIQLVRRIGANARYFTDSAGKVPVDVSLGAASAGIVIDFMGRFQAELSSPPGRGPVMAYATPVGGSSVTADPLSLLRGAPHRELAVRFIEFVLSEEGQRLWNYRTGTPGGPRRFALRRLPIRRDFYPSDDRTLQAAFESHKPYLSDPLGSPASDAYQLGASFLYVPRWTSVHFGVQRDLIRAMCMDSGDELRSAWRAILAHGGPAQNPEAIRLMESMPERPVPLTWSSAITSYNSVPRLDYLREWTAFFREHYRLAEQAAEHSESRP